MVECNLCAASEVGKAYTKELLAGTKTLADAADRFTMSIEQVWIHVMHHAEDLTIDKASLSIEDKLWMLIRISEDWLFELIVHEKPGVRTVKQVTSLLAEIRKLLTTVAEVKGQMPRGPNVNVLQLNSFISLAVGQLCDDCQRKVLSLLEGMPKEMLAAGAIDIEKVEESQELALVGH